MTDTIKNLILDLCFELSIEYIKSNFDYDNSQKVSYFVESIEASHSAEIEVNSAAQESLTELKQLLEEMKSRKSTVSKEDLKAVYLMLKNRELHPKGTFDRMRRFTLDDEELVDVQEPSIKYPYRQMNAGRTSKFVKAVSDKYACQNIDELIARFDKPKTRTT